jgi:uncharacterized linocin/CFP29 family protein
MVANAPATLRKDEWIQMDNAVIQIAKNRLKFVADVRRRGLQYTIPNGMGKTVLQSQNVSDISGANISMDGLKQGENDRQHFDIENLPLPIIHKDWFMSTRELATSRNSGSPLDTAMAEGAGRAVAEEVEKLFLGLSPTYTYGGGTIYGLLNTPHRITKVLTNPTAGGWKPKTLVTEVLQMKELSQQAFHYGPWALYASPAWDVYLDSDYSDDKGDNTLRERLGKLTGVEGVTTLDFLTGYQMILCQMSSENIRAVVGMEIMNLQWDTNGGLQKNFKTMCIIVPQFRADQNDNTGIVHGAAV